MRNAYLRSTAFRLSVRYALLYSVLSAIVLVAAFLFARGELHEWIDDDVRATHVELARTFEQGGLSALIAEVRRLSVAGGRNSMIYALTSERGDYLAGNARGIPGAQSTRRAQIVDRALFQLDGDFNHDVTRFSLRAKALGDATLVVGKSTHLLHETTEALGGVMAAGLLVIFAVGLTSGLLVGRLTERRIDAVRRTLAAVSDGDLSRRAPISRSADDLDRVSQSINSTLDRLQALVDTQQQISADIAHDLKTPIQRLRQRLERARPEGARTTELIEKCVSETDSIIHTFQALLRIAQIEGGARRARFRSMDLRPLCDGVIAAFEPVAEDGGQLVSAELTDSPIEVEGDEELLTQLIANLIENAIRHCDAGVKIFLSLSRMNGSVILSVSDTGGGIPAEERDQVFRRLYRLEKSRTSPGNGLGLSLVKAIADLHDAEIEMTDNRPGLRVDVKFNAARSSSI
jgi:signal transduction histidine kinase